MLCIKRKDFNCYFVISLITLIGFVCNNETLQLFIALIQLVAVILRARISLFSILTGLLNFCLLQQYAAYTGWKVYGLLSISTTPIYYNELCICIYCFNLLMLFFILFTDIIKNEEKLFSVEIEFEKFLSLLLLIFALAITILIFPSLPTLINFASGSRFRQGILQFSGWSIVPYFFLAAASTNNKINKLTITCIMIIVLWYAFHGERVEGIGFMTFLAIKYYHQNKTDKSTLLKIGILGAIFVVIFIAIGILRTGVSDITVSNLINNIIIQPTACDVTYVFNCAVDLWKRGTQYGGITYLSYLANCIPRMDDPYSFAYVIQKDYYTAGGGLFFAEPIANFGIAFSIIISFLYILCIANIIKHNTRYTYLLYSALCISVFRSAWYGLNYPIITMLYFAPFVLLLNQIFKKN